MDRPLRIKPHHFVDIITTVGRSGVEFAPHPYGHAVHSVAEALLADRQALLELTVDADDICEPCSHNIDGLCDDEIDTSFRPLAPSSKRKWNMLLDNRWLGMLGLSDGDCLNAFNLCQMVAEHVHELEKIYHEMPKTHTADRAANLRKGIEFYLK